MSKIQENLENIPIFNLAINKINLLTLKQKEALYYKLQHELFKDDV